MTASSSEVEIPPRPRKLISPDEIFKSELAIYLRKYAIKDVAGLKALLKKTFTNRNKQRYFNNNGKPHPVYFKKISESDGNFYDLVHFRQALQILTPDTAVQLFLSESIQILNQKIETCQELLDKRLKIYSLEDLVSESEQFIHYLKTNRTPLVKTGYFSTPFESTGTLFKLTPQWHTYPSSDSLTATVNVRLAALRQKFFHVKLCILEQILLALKKGNSGDLWNLCFEIITKQFLDDDLQFLLNVEKSLYCERKRTSLDTNFYAEDFDFESGYFKVGSYGGLITLIITISQFEREIQTGYDHHTRELLDQYFSMHPTARFFTSYFDFEKANLRTSFDWILDHRISLEDSQESLINDFHGRVRSSFNNDSIVEFFLPYKREFVRTTKKQRNSLIEKVAASESAFLAQLSNETVALDSQSSDKVETSTSKAQYKIFMDESGNWNIVLGVHSVTIKDSKGAGKGMEYIARILKNGHITTWKELLGHEITRKKRNTLIGTDEKSFNAGLPSKSFTHEAGTTYSSKPNRTTTTGRLKTTEAAEEETERRILLAEQILDLQDQFKDAKSTKEKNRIKDNIESAKASLRPDAFIDFDASNIPRYSALVDRRIDLAQKQILKKSEVIGSHFKETIRSVHGWQYFGKYSWIVDI